MTFDGTISTTRWVARAWLIDRSIKSRECYGECRVNQCGGADAIGAARTQSRPELRKKENFKKK